MKDLTKGNPAKVMLEFAMPVALGNIFQLCYSLADTRVVGSTLGETALAAVGATTSISTLFVGFLSGLTNGFAILVAREFGGGHERELKRYGAGTLLLGVLTALALTVLCVAGLPWLLALLNVPDALMKESSFYIRIILLGLVMTCMYNGCAGILRAVGDTTAALVFLVCASVLNIGLDLAFILIFKLGVAGAALATVISQAVSVACSLIYMMKRYPVFRFQPVDFQITREEVRELYSSGLSMAAMMSLVFFGTLSLQCAINTFGNEIIVAHTAARKITEFCMLPFSVLGVTMATYCGQNIGAGRLDRIRQGLRHSLMISAVWAVGMIVLCYTAAPAMVHLVTGSVNEEIMYTASLYLKVNSVLFFVTAVICIVRNALQAMGEHWIPLVSSGIELVGKVAVAFLLTPLIQYWGIIVAEPIVWVLMVIPLIIRMRQRLKEADKITAFSPAACKRP
ncbi:MAG: MATE family efflux transporter [Lachnospiraceae bacterium]|nr:MATE family efflux transporter [Lachnospiraceae bacterium]